MNRAAGVLLAALGLAGCSNEPAAAFNERKMLHDLAHDVVVPMYFDFEDASRDLATALGALESSPDAATLAAAQTAWRNARKAWKVSQAVGFGPVEMLDIHAIVDWFPAKPAAIEEAIAKGTLATSESIDSLGANVRGFMALEYLLFDPEGGDAAVLAALDDPSRRAFVRALGENVAAQATRVRQVWDPADVDFASELDNAGAGSVTYPTTKSATDAIVNRLVFVVETLADKEIGKPFGKASGGAPQPDLDVAGRSDNSLADMLAELYGIDAVSRGTYGAKDELGIEDLVASIDPALAQRMAASVFAAQTKVAAIPPPFRVAISGHPAEVEAAWQAAKEQKRLLSTDVAGALGVTLTFGGNDGD